jgi:hypothetical protein
VVYIYLKNITTFGDNMTFDDYSLHDHKHRFSAWAASTAARASRKKCHFSVEEGKKILESADIEESIQQIPKIKSQEKFDEWHKDMCNRLISNAKSDHIQGFTFGVAAKLLNCYLKSYFVDYLDELKFIHPPIDRLLLDELAYKNIGNQEGFWKRKSKIGWSNFKEEDYSEVIKSIKEALHKIEAGCGLWKIEYYWAGHQSK